MTAALQKIKMHVKQVFKSTLYILKFILALFTDEVNISGPGSFASQIGDWRMICCESRIVWVPVQCTYDKKVAHVSLSSN